MTVYLALQRGAIQAAVDGGVTPRAPRVLLEKKMLARGVELKSFGGPENEGQWTLGPAAQISFYIQPGTWPGGLWLRMRGRPMRGAGHRARVGIRINGADLVYLKFWIYGWTTFFFPVPLKTDSHQMVTCDWIIDNPRTPFSCGEGNDHRLLGMQVRKIELMSDADVADSSILMRWKMMFKRARQMFGFRRTS